MTSSRSPAASRASSSPRMKVSENLGYIFRTYAVTGSGWPGNGMGSRDSTVAPSDGACQESAGVLLDAVEAAEVDAGGPLVDAVDGSAQPVADGLRGGLLG